MWIVDVRAKIWDFSNVRTQKWVRPKCPWNVISLLFMYFNLVKFSKNLQNFLKRRPRRRFGRFTPENLKPLQSNPPPSGRNPAIETPLGGSETPLYLVLTPKPYFMCFNAFQSKMNLGGPWPQGGPFWVSKVHIFGLFEYQKYKFSAPKAPF